MPSRRQFLGTAPWLTAAAAAASLKPERVQAEADLAGTEAISLDGEWEFRIEGGEWQPRIVPHTWQVEPALAEYRGVAWYRRTFVSPHAPDAVVRIEFEAVFHSAEVWVNGSKAGEHIRKPYTAFCLNLTKLVQKARPNSLVVRVDNSFDEHMLPRGHSSDWAHDGGIYRPVNLLITPPVFIERVDVDALPDLATGEAEVGITAVVQNQTARPFQGFVQAQVIDDETGLPVTVRGGSAVCSAVPGQTTTVHMGASFPQAKLWHFDHPHLYRLEVAIVANGESASHSVTTTFGVRRFAVEKGGFVLNGERVRLMGVERMAGSNPEYGMAEPASWIVHDHDDLKHLNCMFSRVHWQQDKRVLEYCDRHGILMQTEVPTWGANTFKGMGEQPDADIMQNGLEQLREMIARDRNHPSIVSWGLCNEIGGQNPPAYNFAKNMLAEAKRLDRNRLCSYASHSLRETPGKDVAGLMDFVEANEYFGSWYPGGADAAANNVDEIHAAFPDKPIVISEYGYCACTAERPEGDERRREILRTHDAALRSRPFVAGLIFFCYNDYRTHIGDRGTGVMKQRVHGVVDLYGAPKGSYELLREQSSPIESLLVEGHPASFRLTLRTRNTIPAYTLTGYKLRAVYYGYGEIPIERKEASIPVLAPGESASLAIAFRDDLPWRVQFDVLRPNGFSAYTLQWRT